MKWFHNMKIASKLILSYVIIAVMSGVVGVIAIRNIEKMTDNDATLYENMTVPLSEVAEINSLFQRARVNARDLIFEDDQEVIQETYDYVLTFMNEMKTIADNFSKTIVQEEVEAAYEEYLSAYDAYMQDLEKLLELCLQNRDDEAYEFTKGTMQDSSDELRSVIEKLVELKVNGAKKQADANEDTSNSAVITMIGVVSGVIVAAICLGIFISNTISRPVRTLAAGAEKIADGDLNVYIDINTKDEIGDLANAFNKMADNLNEVISNINAASEQVAAGSRQVADSSIELS